MVIRDAPVSASRRTLLGGLLGGLVGLALQALGRPATVHAGSDGDVVLGGINTTTQSTSITTSQVDGTALQAEGTAAGSTGLWGRGDAAGVFGSSLSSTGRGVWASAQSGTAVYATNVATNQGLGLLADNYNTTQPAIVGESIGNNTGVFGYSGPNPLPSSPGKVGVYGLASQSSASVGVMGRSNAGRGGGFIGHLAQLRLYPSPASTHPSTGARGDLFVDKSGRLWFCKGGTSWKQLA